MRISFGSLAFSWIVALCLLGLISIWSRPPMTAGSTPNEVIQLSPIHNAVGAEQQDHLGAKVWCTLDSRQVVRVTIDGKTAEYRGAMAIAPDWRGGNLNNQTAKLVQDCISTRLESLHPNQGGTPGETSALAYLFSNL